MDIAPPLPPHGGFAPVPPSIKTTAKCSAAQTATTEIEQSDFLAIDDLLDFSNEDIGGPIEPCLSNATSCELKIEPPVLPSSADRKMSQPCGFDSDLLCMPCDDLAELEWLSNFVEESFSSGDAPGCLGWGTYGSFDDERDKDKNRRNSDESFRTTSPVSVLESHSFSRGKHCPPFSFSPEMSPVPGRARSKRCRTPVCFWNTRILSPEVSESLLETASTTYAIQAASSDSNMYNTYYDYDDDDDDEDFLRIHANQRVMNSPMKVKDSSCNKAKNSNKLFNPKPKKMKIKVEDVAPVRKCLHCATQKTPQWRAGPMGPKTLCNACGVRYKSGRLCEEYRPAASPTFIESVHSNSHRKVLEMRKQRDDMGNGHESQKYKDNTHRLRRGDHGDCDRFAKTDDNRDASSDEKELDRIE